MWSFFKFFSDHVGRNIKAFVLGFCGFGSVYSTFVLNIHDIDKSGASVFVVKTLVGVIASVTSGFILSLIKERREKNNSKTKNISNGKDKDDAQRRA